MEMFTAVPCTPTALAAMPWPPWSMLYMTAFGPPASLAILNTMRSSRPPACSVPCQLPVNSCACATPADSATTATVQSISFRMAGLYPSVRIEAVTELPQPVERERHPSASLGVQDSRHFEVDSTVALRSVDDLE